MKTKFNNALINLDREVDVKLYHEQVVPALRAVGTRILTSSVKGCTASDREWAHINSLSKLAGRPQEWPPESRKSQIWTAEVELETEHLFSDQWNVARPGENGIRIHDALRVEYENRKLVEYFWLDRTDEMKHLLASTFACGFCAHKVHKLTAFTHHKVHKTDAPYKFCPKCLGSAHLEEKNLHLLRMKPVRVDGPDGRKIETVREELTEAEKPELVALFLKAQTTAKKSGFQLKANEAKALFDKKSETARIEYDGTMWFLARDLETDNLIYYDHSQTFCLGWRSSDGLDEKVILTWKEKLQGFPYKIDFKGRK